MNAENQNPNRAAAPVLGGSSGTDAIQALLAETGLDDDDTAEDLVPALLELRALGAGPLSAPSPAVIALLDEEAAGSRDGGNLITLAGRRQRRTDSQGTSARRPVPRGRRIGLTALAVAACLGLAGGTAAAADEGFRHAAGDAVTFLVGTITGAHPGQHPTPPAAPGQDNRPAAPSRPTERNSGQGGPGEAPSTDHPAPPASPAPRGTEAGNPPAASPTPPAATDAPTAPGTAKEPAPTGSRHA